MNEDACPRGDKNVYENRAAAFRRMSKHKKRHSHVYPCRCGRWHLGRRLKRAVVAWRAMP